MSAANGKPVRDERLRDELARLLAHHLPEPAPEVPVSSLRDAIPFLRRPFSPEAVKWKVQTSWPKDEPRAGQVIAYIDARLVVERLNLVCPDLWSERFELFSTGQGGQSTLWCHLTIDGTTHSDVGEGKGKALVSDARKRAGVAFGIGVSLYALPAVKMQAGNGSDRLPVRGPEGKRTLRIEAPQVEWLRLRYEAWLDTIGIRAFGQPLDHGDAPDAAGDPHDPDNPVEDGDGPIFEDPEPPKPNGRKISRERAEQIAEAFASRAPESVTPGDLLAKLAEIAGKPIDDPVAALRALKEQQAGEVEEWISGLA